MAAKAKRNPKSAAKPQGRPTKKTDDRLERLIVALKVGLSRAAACRAAGVCAQTLANWVEADAGLAAKLDQAESEHEYFCAQQVMKAAVGDKKRPGDWRAAAFALERRHSKDWGRRDRIEHDVSKLSDDELIAEAAACIRAAGAESLEEAE